MVKKMLSEAWEAVQLPSFTTQSSSFWVGVAYGILAFVLLVSGAAGFYSSYWFPSFLLLLAGMLVGGLVYFLSLGLTWLLLRVTKPVPNFVILSLGGAIGALFLFRFFSFRWPSQIYQPTALVYLLISGILGGSLALLIKNPRLAPNKRRGATIATIVSVSLIICGIFWVGQEGKDVYNTSFDRSAGTTTLASLGIKNPSESGKYSFEHFTYGSGTDQKRPAFASAVKFQSNSVDAQLLLPDWKGKKKKWRERYWGFGADAFPLNGRVWMPAGEGPFPLVLMVHGNHSMEDYSDEGYAYLGELLASQGNIAVSVDENFLNGTWSGDFRGKEMPARAWLLLKHLEQWSVWSRDANHSLYQKADLDQVALIGHSRGGEAVSIAAAFNELPFFPDNAQAVFNFRFGIKGVVAIAPTDYRYNRQMQLQNVSYLSLQGSYDADEASFFGLRQYHRVQLTDTSDYRFKAGIYIHGANHGQFNTTWDRTDFGAPYNWLLNTAPIIPRVDQEQAAKVFIGAFAQMVFHANDGGNAYRPLFQHTATAGNWLAPGIYLGHFKDTKANILADFESEIDLAKEPNGILLKAPNTQVWKEEQLLYRNDDKQGNNGLILAWDYGDTLKTDSIASYQISFSDTFSRKAQQLLLTIATGDPGLLKNKEGEMPDLDFSISLTDTSGRVAQVVLSAIKKVAPQLKVRYTKIAQLDKGMFKKAWEITPETFTIPFNSFDTTAGFNFNAVQQIRMVFDQVKKGVVVLDEIGFSQ